MMQKHFKMRRRFLVPLVLTILFISLGPVLRDRIKLITSYVQLVSSNGAKSRLNYVPPVEVLSSISEENMLSVGYASFIFPFKLDKVFANESATVVLTIDPTIQMVIAHPYSSRYKPMTAQDRKRLESGSHLVYEGGQPKVKQGLNKRGIRIYELAAQNPYSFDKQIMEATPKSLLGVVFMRMDALHLYEYMLEDKNVKMQVYNGQKPFFFETPLLKGFVGHSVGETVIESSTSQIKYDNALAIEFWCPAKEIRQFIKIRYKAQSFDLEKAKKLLSSFRYLTDQLDNREVIYEVILNTFKTHPAYTADSKQLVSTQVIHVEPNF